MSVDPTKRFHVGIRKKRYIVCDACTCFRSVFCFLFYWNKKIYSIAFKNTMRKQTESMGKMVDGKERI